MGARSLHDRTSRRSARGLVAAATAAIGVLAAPSRVRAATSSWADGTGSWSLAGNWTGGVPINGSDVSIVNADAISRTITYDTNGAGITLRSLTIDNTGAGTNGLSQSANLLSVGGSALEYVGFNGNGQYLQSGGTNSAAGGLTIGLGGLARGVYGLSGGTVTTTVLTVGGGGIGTFNQAGGLVTLSNSLFLATGTAGLGTYSLSNGATLNVNTQEVVGNGGNAVFNQTGGTHTVGGVSASNGLTISAFAGTATATYLLSGGNLTVSSGTSGVQTFVDEVIGGPNATGSFLHSGGVNTISFGDLVIDGRATGRPAALYAMSNGATLNVTSGTLYAGQSGSGVFNQTGGTVNFANAAGVTVGYNGGSSGTVNLSGGTLGTASQVWIGAAGNGTLNQSGGNLAAGTLYLGVFAPADGLGGTGNGVYNQTGGTLDVSGTEYVGGNGNGTFNQSGGTVNAGFLFLAYNTGNNAGEFGTYSLSNGATLNLSGTLFVGIFGNGTFNQTGGIVNATTAGVVIGQGQPGTADAYNLTGGTLNAQTVVVQPNGTFNQTGGSLVASSFQLAGGSVTGTLQNRGAFTYQSGTFAGRMINDGTVTFASAFTMGNGLQNDVAMSVSGTQTLTLNSLGLDNLGTFNLNGGTLNGAATQTNDYGGTFNGAGTVASPMVNNGSLNVTGLLTLSNTLTNAGVTTVPGGGAGLRVAGLSNYGALNVSGSVILNGPANNAGVITLSPGGGIAGGAGGSLVNGPGGLVQGAGGVSAALTNSGGNLSATSSTPLVLSNFTGGNVNGGQINVGPAGVLQVLTPFNNAALITLGGPGASLGGGSISNTGTIKGMGNVSNVVLNAAGVVRAEGGTLQLSAVGNTNGPGGQLQAPAGATLFYPAGLASNAGLIALSGGAFDNNNQPLTNTNLIAGNGILRTGGLLNSGTLILSDVASQVYGSVTNGGSIKVVSNTTTFYGPVTNNGTIKTTAATARFLAPFVNNGIYTSDPSEQSFTDLTVGPSGAIVGGLGDRFTLTGDFHSRSTCPAAWQTDEAAIEFAAGGPSASHVMDVLGLDGGGYAGNFAWGDLTLDAGQSLVLADGDTTLGGALYVRGLHLADAPGGAPLPAFIASHLVNFDAGDAVNVYYDPSQSANAYLAGGTYALGNGGTLAPANTPEPVGGIVGGFVLLGSSLLGRRARRPRSATARDRTAG